MEKHFLSDFVIGIDRAKPEPRYIPEGDCIIYQIADEAPIAERVDEILTIYNSAKTGRSIGYQIKEVGALAKKFGWDLVMVECKRDDEEIKEVSLSALLLAAYEQGPKTIGRRKAYAGALESFAANPRISAADLVSA